MQPTTRKTTPAQVLDLDRYRLKRQLLELRERMEPEDWRAFFGELIRALAFRMRTAVDEGDDYADESAEEDGFEEWE